eukprot:NODE_4_length_55019_cov_0.425091.p39 type:complete len:108 gc:universal NODE_4_length_55019_cov_0.425091:34046-33723(-)
MRLSQTLNTRPIFTPLSAHGIPMLLFLITIFRVQRHSRRQKFAAFSVLFLHQSFELAFLFWRHAVYRFHIIFIIILFLENPPQLVFFIWGYALHRFHIIIIFFLLFN